MRKMLRPSAAAMATLSTVLLLGCSTQETTPQANAANGPYTVDTPLEVIAANPKGDAILVQDVPGVMSSPKYPMIEDMSLAQIAIFANGKIPPSKLDQVQTDLDQLAAAQAAAAKAAAEQAAAQKAAEKAAEKAAKQAKAKPAASIPAAAPAAAAVPPAVDQAADQTATQ